MNEREEESASDFRQGVNSNNMSKCDLKLPESINSFIQIT